MRVSESDWALLNAYVDGELPRHEASKLAARLETEPALSAEYERLRGLKGDLSSLGAGRFRRRPWTTPVAAVAAAAACLLLLGWIGVADGPWWQPQPLTVEAIHRDFAVETADVAPLPSAGASFAGIRAPDLSSSNLTLVALRRLGAEGEEGAAWHYRGRRGCRITLVAGPVAAEAGRFALARRWRAGGTDVAIVAEGMDPDRFAAIADLAEARTRGTEDGEKLRVAVVERTASAAPCA